MLDYYISYLKTRTKKNLHLLLARGYIDLVKPYSTCVSLHSNPSITFLHNLYYFHT
jgi:hypothetical protein